jgi:hypothetical protein
MPLVQVCCCTRMVSQPARSLLNIAAFSSRPNTTPVSMFTLFFRTARFPPGDPVADYIRRFRLRRGGLVVGTVERIREPSPSIGDNSKSVLLASGSNMVQNPAIPPAAIKTRPRRTVILRPVQAVVVLGALAFDNFGWAIARQKAITVPVTSRGV